MMNTENPINGDVGHTVIPKGVSRTQLIDHEVKEKFVSQMQKNVRL